MRIALVSLVLALAGVCPVQAQDSLPEAGKRLRVSSDGHWLQFQGKPILLVGDSVTQGWMELGTDFDQEAYLQALGRRGINAVLLWSYTGITGQEADERIAYDAPELWPWARDGGRFDLGRFNAAYFDRLREFVRLANQRSIVVVITVHDGWTKTKLLGHPFYRGNGGPLESREQYVQLHDYDRELSGHPSAKWSPRQKHQYYLERFCDRLLEATADLPNVMYEMFNEGEWYDQEDLRAFQVHFVKFFRARTALPVAVNDDHVGGRDFRREPGVDVISLHKPRWDDCPPARTFFTHYQSEFTGLPARPILFSEPVPEYGGDPARHAGVVHLLWGTILGGAGVVLQNDASFGFAPRAGMAARAASRDAALDLEGYAARFFNDGRIPFTQMRPDGRLSSTGLCLSDAGNQYVVYAPEGEPLTVDLSAAEGKWLNATWYDPFTGKTVPGGKLRGGSPASPFRPPFAGDAVLHLSGAPQNERP